MITPSNTSSGPQDSPTALKQCHNGNKVVICYPHTGTCAPDSLFKILPVQKICSEREIIMSFSDIFKRSFLDGFTSLDINIYTAATAMLITSVIAFYIFIVYRLITRKTFYSKTFNISIAVIAVITSAVIITIQSSIVVSLGMVGALSIVRFRKERPDPSDLLLLF